MSDQIETTKNNSGGWIVGAVLVLLGVVFLLNNVLNINLGNWWALFILIPALGSFNNAYRTYVDNGRVMTPHARNSLMWGILFLLVTAIMLFNLNWSILGPAILILLGLGILLNGLFK